MKNDKKNIKVFIKNNGELQYLSSTTTKIVNKMLKRNKCKWIEHNRSIEIYKRNEDIKKLKKEVINKANRICYICGRKIEDNEIATADHVKPKKQGGEDVFKNLRCCCSRCNEDKSDKNIYQYVRHIEKNRDKYRYVSNSQIKKIKKEFF